MSIQWINDNKLVKGLIKKLGTVKDNVGRQFDVPGS